MQNLFIFRSTYFFSTFKGAVANLDTKSEKGVVGHPHFLWKQKKEGKFKSFRKKENRFKPRVFKTKIKSVMNEILFLTK